jgi:class 3 adenylate cyclase/tetratricopeptide (TPR) repeat protein
MELPESLAFGELLRQQRTERGWTQEELCRRSGLSIEAIGTLERGVRHLPRQTTIHLLARALELSDAEQLWFETVARHSTRASPRSRRQPTSVVAGTESKVHTFLAANIRGPLRLRAEHGSAAANELAATFALLTRSGVAARGGQMVDLHDGEALAMFASAHQGLRAAIELQARFEQVLIAEPAIPLNVGIGVEVGPAQLGATGYRGAAIKVATRLCALAGPGEILTTEVVVQLARTLDGLDYSDRGFAQLKGLADPVRVLEARRSAAPSTPDRPPRRVRTLEEQTRQAKRLPIGSYLGALPAGPILGRGQELGRILSMIDMVAGGTGQMLLLSGEAGVGKTRLAQEIDLDARNLGFLVASGRCYEQQQATALYPMTEVLTSLFEAAPAFIRADAGRKWPYLGQLFPHHIEPHRVAFAGPNDEQRLHYAVAGFLQAVAATAPVALLLDDLHWADSSSLALLQHLSRHTRGDRVLLVGTFRDIEVGYQQVLKGALRDLNREGLIAQVDVRRLDSDATSALLAAILGEESVSASLTHFIHQRSEGNPYFVEHLLRALMERGELFQSWDRKAVTEIQVPESVRAVIAQRFDRLSTTTQSILRDASVLGQRFIFDDLAAMEGRTEEDLDDSLEEATHAGMVGVMGNDGYAFDHALTQQTLYEELSPRRRRTLHLQAGAVLESLPVRRRERRVAELAWHYQQGHDPQKAIPWTILAGDQAEAVFSHRDAELRYRTVLDLAHETRDQKVRSEVLEKLGRVLKVVGRYDDSLQALEESAALCRAAGDEDGELRAVAQIGQVQAVRGTPGEGVTRLQSLVDSLEGTSRSSELVGLYVALAKLYIRSGRYSAQLTAASRAVDLARGAGDDQFLAQGLQQRA